MPDQSQGKLIVYNGLYLARSVQASPYANCGTGNVGWVQLQADGSLGCMECASISIHPSKHYPHCPVIEIMPLQMWVHQLFATA